MKQVVLSITGASGAGKSTLESGLCAIYGGGRVRTITTRKRREDEPADAYHFLTASELDEIDKRSQLLWRIKTHGNQYAVTRPAFYEALVNGKGVAFISITPKQHIWVEDAFKYNADLVMVKVHLDIPSLSELWKRLRERGDNEASIAKRVADSEGFETAAAEVPDLHRIKPCSRNDTLMKCVALIESARK